MTFNLLVSACVAYVLVLFAVAFAAERGARAGRFMWLRSSVVYTLSLSIYCTGWTFFGAVGYGARSGLEYVTIYLGPTLVMVGWWWILRKLVRIGRTQRITSIADLISSRYGKSNLLGVGITLMVVVTSTPYIALQLQSVSLSFEVFAQMDALPRGRPRDMNDTGFWVAAGLALFTILFGTRNLDAHERHHGVVIAIALEACVKLLALVAVGAFVVWAVADGPSDIFARIAASSIGAWDPQPARWMTLMFLSGAAFLTLPRMFQVLVVENVDERHVQTAAWAFPLYLFALSLFVLPIAVVGLNVMPIGANPDMFVLTLPLAFDQGGLAMLAFLGGFSSATSMVIVAAIALSTMVSNHIVMPIWLSLAHRGASISGDVRDVVLAARRASIIAVLALGYLYFRLSGGGAALAAIGLISFAGVAQILPAMLGGIFWRGATRRGAIWGLSTGFALWLYTMFLPSFGPSLILSQSLLDFGPFGLNWLRPQGLFGTGAMDPLVHAVFWSLFFNVAAFVIASLMSFPGPLERLQGAQFVNVFDHTGAARGWSKPTAESEDLLIMAQRILGAHDAQTLFESHAAQQGKGGYLPDPTPEFIASLERELAGSVGAATAHAMLGQILGGAVVSVQDLMAVADETAQMLEYSSQLEAKSSELTRTARQLREANEKLTTLSIQKDAFLSQISHELRTPMTSIRAFSEILMESDAGTPQNASSNVDRIRYAGIIQDEAMRLTRLLDDLLDLAVLENGQVTLNRERVNLGAVVDRAIAASEGARALEGRANLAIVRSPALDGVWLETDADRLAQVFINLISNARKYCVADQPRLRISMRRNGDQLRLDFVDNGKGIVKESQSVIFEKFSRLSDHRAAGGAGLGLAICREILTNLGGDITYLPGQGGAAFRVLLPLTQNASA